MLLFIGEQSRKVKVKRKKNTEICKLFYKVPYFNKHKHLYTSHIKIAQLKIFDSIEYINIYYPLISNNNRLFIR
jgi:hypothetical protein